MKKLCWGRKKFPTQKWAWTPNQELGQILLHPIILNLHPTQFEIFKNDILSENKNPELKITHFRKIDPEEMIMLWK